MASPGLSPLPNFLPKHHDLSSRFFFSEFLLHLSPSKQPFSKRPFRDLKPSFSVRTNAVYTEASRAIAAIPRKEKRDSPSDIDDITILNERIRRELGKRQGLRAGNDALDSSDVEKYLKTVKQQQQLGIRKLKGDAMEKGGIGYKVDPYTLEPGDYVVHKKVGIGKFAAIKYDVSKSSSEPTEYVFIEYADGMAKLPVKQACRMLYRYNL